MESSDKIQSIYNDNNNNKIVSNDFIIFCRCCKNITLISTDTNKFIINMNPTLKSKCQKSIQEIVSQSK